MPRAGAVVMHLQPIYTPVQQYFHRAVAPADYKLVYHPHHLLLEWLMARLVHIHGGQWIVTVDG